ncbi:MAG: DUF4403 family protein [Polyangiales bacterium]
MRPTWVRRCVPVLALIAVGVACKRAPAPPAVQAGACSVSVASANRTTAPPNAPSPIASSQIPVEVRVELAIARKTVESQVPKRVGAASGVPIGTAGRVTYTIDRGPFSFVMVGESLVARTDLTITASVCKPVPGLGCVQYGSCTPLARVDAALPTQLTDQYALKASTVSIVVTRRCLMTALDIDVTPILESKAAEEAKKLKAKIDGSLPNPRKEVAHAWDLAQTSLPLGKDACVQLHPRSLVQGPTSIVKDQLVARFAVVAEPTVDSPCGDEPQPTPLPPLARDTKLDPRFAVHLPVRVATSSIEAAWQKALAGKSFDAGPALTIQKIAARPSSVGLDLDLDVNGTACTTLFFEGTPQWDEGKHAVRLAPLVPSSGEVDRLKNALDPIKLETPLADALSYVPPIDDVSFGKSLEQAKELVTEKDREIELVIEKTGSEGVVVNEKGLEIRFLLEGHAAIHIVKL